MIECKINNAQGMYINKYIDVYVSKLEFSF